jgi:hypothetical protein
MNSESAPTLDLQTSAALHDAPQDWPDVYATPHGGGSFAGGLWATIAVAPLFVIAGVLTGYFLTPGENALQIAPGAIGAIGAVLAWFLTAWVVVVLDRTSPGGADPQFFGVLMEVADRTKRRIAAIRGPDRATDADGQTYLAHLELAREQYLDGVRTLEQPSARWVLGVGYVAVLRRFQRADELLQEIESNDEVHRTALIDHFKLISAPPFYYGSLGRHLEERLTRVMKSFEERPSPSDDRSKQDKARSPWRERLDVTEVHRWLNQLQEEHLSLLLRARNYVTVSSTLLGLVTLAILLLGLAAGTRRDVILGAAACYVVGATVGMFERLYRVANYASGSALMGGDAQGTSDELRLLSAWNGLTPVLSGLAAIGGVYVTSMLSATSASPAAVQGIDQVFDLLLHPFALLIAAIFGLAPQRLIKSLQSQSGSTETVRSSPPSRSADGRSES